VLFVEYRFLFFFLAVFAVHWTLRPAWARKVWLLLASYVFYAAWDWRFLSLIWTSTIVDYLVGLRLRVEDRDRTRRLLLAISVLVNLGLLGFFKYFGFFVDSAVEFLGWLGLDVGRPALQVVLPVGISFYTFQTMSYTIDGYRRVLTPTRNLLDVSLFVAFFPQLVAGPIVRAADFMPQLRSPRVFANVAVRPALVLFLVGFVKKAVVADNAAVIADAYFADPAAASGFSAFLGVGAYAAQIYGDFSGYSDMAIALAALLGYRLPLNFDYPYLARNITEFWRRWHISLSTWLRDYLYVPLGGNRGGRLFTYRNLMLTMLLGGLWHGAAWRFVVWGGLHGVALVAHREWVRRRPEGLLRPGRIAPVLATAATLYWVCLAWIFFRAQDLSTAWAATRSFLFLDGIGDLSFTAFDGRLAAGGIALVLLGLLVCHVAARLGAFRWWGDLPGWGFAALFGAAIPLVLAFVPVAAAPFIYFQF
jgi:alginate O-acetyltransferase complex protein AlgI